FFFDLKPCFFKCFFPSIFRMKMKKSNCVSQKIRKIPQMFHYDDLSVWLQNTVLFVKKLNSFFLVPYFMRAKNIENQIKSFIFNRELICRDLNCFFRTRKKFSCSFYRNFRVFLLIVKIKNG